MDEKERILHALLQLEEMIEVLLSPQREDAKNVMLHRIDEARAFIEKMTDAAGRIADNPSPARWEPRDNRLPTRRERTIMTEPVLIMKSGQAFSNDMCKHLLEELRLQIMAKGPGAALILGPWCTGYKWKYGRVEHITEFFDDLGGKAPADKEGTERGIVSPDSARDALAIVNLFLREHPGLNVVGTRDEDGPCRLEVFKDGNNML